MALALTSLYARSGWRARAVFSGGNPSGISVGAFAITRSDGGPCTVVVLFARPVDGTALELVLSERLLSRAIYLLTWSATSTPFSFIPPLSQDPSVQAADDDPDAEANGVDLAWISNDPTPSGDCDRRSGVSCVQYDLLNRAALVPGELVQDVTAGANIGALVNSSSSDSQLLQAGAKLEAEFRRDQRVADADVNVTVGTAGQTFFGGQVQTRAGQQAPVRSQ